MNGAIKTTSNEITTKAGYLLLALVVGSAIASLQLMNPLYVLLAMIGVAAVALALNPWTGVILVILGAQVNFYRFDYGPVTIRPEQVIFIIAAVSWLILVFARRRAVIHKTILNRAIWALLIVGLLSTFLNSHVPRAGYQALLLLLVYVSMYFFTANVLLNNRSKVDTVVKVLMIVAALHALYAIIGLALYTGGVYIGGVSKEHVIVSGYPSTTGLLVEPNLFGAFSGMMLLLFASHLVTQGKKIMKTRYLVAGLALMLIATITSMTRGCWIGVGVALPALIFMNRPRWNVVNPRAIAMIFLAVPLFIAVIPVADYALSSQGNDNALVNRMSDILNVESGTAEGRIQIGSMAMAEWRENPIIGKGVMSFTATNTKGWIYGTYIQNIHDMGLIGLGLTIWITLVPAVYALWASTKTRDSIRKANLIGLGLGAVVMAIASQASSFFWLGFPWIFLGIVVAISKITFDEDRGDKNAALTEEVV